MDQVERERRLEALFATYASEVLAYALRRGLSRPDAEDVMVETFVVCCRHLEEMPDLGLAWLLAVARRVLANHRRAKTRQGRLLERISIFTDRPAPPAGLAAPIGDRELAQALGALSHAHREALLLVAWEGLTQGEAARVLGCSRSFFARRSSRRAANCVHIWSASGHKGQ